MSTVRTLKAFARQQVRQNQHSKAGAAFRGRVLEIHTPGFQRAQRRAAAIQRGPLDFDDWVAAQPDPPMQRRMLVDAVRQDVAVAGNLRAAVADLPANHPRVIAAQRGINAAAFEAAALLSIYSQQQRKKKNKRVALVLQRRPIRRVKTVKLKISKKRTKKSKKIRKGKSVTVKIS